MQEEIDLTNVRELRRELSTHGMRPNKSFGQNFLIDRSVLQKIVDAAEIEATDQVLEVGSGTGVLTRELAQRARRVVAVELERDMLGIRGAAPVAHDVEAATAREARGHDPHQCLDTVGLRPEELLLDVAAFAGLAQDRLLHRMACLTG